MAKSIKKLILNLPLKIVLTESGSNYFIKNKTNLTRFRLIDNTEDRGILVSQFSPPLLQRIIMLGYVSKIEISMPEFTSRRQDLMDLSKLVVYSKLYRQFNSEVLAKLLSSDCVKKHNRAHPGKFFAENQNIDDTQLQPIIQKYNVQLMDIRKTILEPLNQEIIQMKKYTIEEKNMYLLMIEKFLNKLNLYNLYILVLFSKNIGFFEIVSNIRSILVDYIQKSAIAEYISLMLMELVMNSENLNMRKEAEIMYQTDGNNNKILLDPAVRKKILDELIRKNTLVFISWKLGGGSAAIGKKGLLQITLYNRDDEFQEVKESIELKKSADLTKKTLIDFYKELPEGQIGTDLGLYYLSYLNDACKQVNVKFDSHINHFESSDLTVIQLTFKF